MPTLDIKPPAGAEPELNLLLPKTTLEEPLWKSLFQNLDDFFFPKKQPPLVLTSKPIPVKDIWGFYDYKKNGVLGSTVVHILALAVDYWRHHPGPKSGSADRQTARHDHAGFSRRYSSAAAFEDAGRWWWRWRRSRQIPGAQGQAAQAVDGADYSSDDGGAQRQSQADS